MFEFYIRKIPDYFLYIIVYIRLTECQQMFESYYKTIIENNLDNLDNILEYGNDARLKYLQIKKQTEEIANKLQFYIILCIVIGLFCVWYCITLWIVAVELYNENDRKFGKFAVYWAIYFTFESCLYLVISYFMIYPAMVWNEKYCQLKNEVMSSIDSLLNKRKSLKWNGVDTNPVLLYSQQTVSLEFLNRFYRVLNDQPCYYQILGIAISKDNIKVLVLGFIVGKMVSLMWNSVYLD